MRSPLHGFCPLTQTAAPAVAAHCTSMYICMCVCALIAHPEKNLPFSLLVPSRATELDAGFPVVALLTLLESATRLASRVAHVPAGISHGINLLLMAELCATGRENGYH